MASGGLCNLTYQAIVLKQGTTPRGTSGYCWGETYKGQGCREKTLGEAHTHPFNCAYLHESCFQLTQLNSTWPTALFPCT